MIPTTTCPDCRGEGYLVAVRAGPGWGIGTCPGCTGIGRIPDLNDFAADVLNDDDDPVEVGAVVEHVTRSAAYLRSIGKHTRADEADRYLAEVKVLPGWRDHHDEVSQ